MSARRSPGRPRGQNLSVTVAARFSPDEAAILRGIAAARGMSASDFVRHAVQAALAPSGPALRDRNITYDYSRHWTSRTVNQAHAILGSNFHSGPTTCTGV